MANGNWVKKDEDLWYAAKMAYYHDDVNATHELWLWIGTAIALGYLGVAILRENTEIITELVIVMIAISVLRSLCLWTRRRKRWDAYWTLRERSEKLFGRERAYEIEMFAAGHKDI